MPTNSATNAVAGREYSSAGSATCSSLPVAHDADPVGHGQRLLLVVGDEQGGGAEPLLQGADLLAQLQPDLGVERGQRLVEQQHVRLDRQRPGQRDALLLAAGQLVRVLAGLRGQADHVEQLGGRLRRRCAAAIFRMRSPKPTLSSALMFGNRL